MQETKIWVPSASPRQGESRLNSKENTKYISLLSVVQSQPTLTPSTRNQATGFSSNSHHQAYDRKLWKLDLPEGPPYPVARRAICNVQDWHWLFYISTAAHTSTSYGLKPFFYISFIFTFLYLYVFYILQLLYLHFNIYLS
jgi:hypothetical protein